MKPRVKSENSELKILNFTSYKKLSFHCLASVELKPHTKVLKSLFHNMTLKSLYVTPKLPTYFSIGHKICTYLLNGCPQTNAVKHFLCIGSARYTRVSPLARKTQLLPSSLNIQNLVIMFTFFDFERKYHFWVNLFQKIKIESVG